MIQQKILSLLNKSSDSKLMTRKWNIINDQPIEKYHTRNEIIYNTDILKSNLCNCTEVLTFW